MKHLLTIIQVIVIALICNDLKAQGLVYEPFIPGQSSGSYGPGYPTTGTGSSRSRSRVASESVRTNAYCLYNDGSVGKLRIEVEISGGSARARGTISGSVCPEVNLIGSRRIYGRCCPKGSKKKYSEYDFYIEISGHTLKNTEKSLRNTLIHELIHTVPGGLCHTGEWRKWARFVTERTEYNIQRLDGDKTEDDIERMYRGETITGIH